MVGCGVGGNFTLGVNLVQRTNSGLFNLNGVRTVIALIKTEGLITPLATIQKTHYHQVIFQILL